MPIHYALFDQDNGWAWFNKTATPYEMLQQFYYENAAKHLHPSPNDLTTDDLWGGLVKFNDWIVVYRFFNGGRQKGGRPQRFVILTAWIKNADSSVDLSQVFTSGAFQFISEHAKENPVPQPDGTVGSRNFNLSELSTLCRKVSYDAGCEWIHAKIEYVQGQWKEIKTEGRLKPKPPPPPPNSPAFDNDVIIERLLSDKEKLKDNITAIAERMKELQISNQEWQRQSVFNFWWAVSTSVTAAVLLVLLLLVMIIRFPATEPKPVIREREPAVNQTAEPTKTEPKKQEPNTAPAEQNKVNPKPSEKETEEPAA